MALPREELPAACQSCQFVREPADCTGTELGLAHLVGNLHFYHLLAFLRLSRVLTNGLAFI